MKKMHSLFVVGLQALWSAVCRSDLKHLRNGITKWLIGFYDRVVYKHQTAYYIPLSINSIYTVFPKSVEHIICGYRSQHCQ